MACLTTGTAVADTPDMKIFEVGFAEKVRPLVAKYCLGCHASAKKEGGLDLERFTTVALIQRDVKPWQNLVEQVEAEEMPPRDKPQPTAEERRQIVAWTRGFLDAEAKSRTGDPGRTLLRRLSNAEYDATIRDLTGVDMRPAREFPVDGAGGEGFTNAGESLSEISPALLARYLQAAKHVADRAVLLPEGFRFSPSATRRDWTDESTAKLRTFYKNLGETQAGMSGTEGKLLVQPYLLATVRDRDALAAGRFEAVAAKDKLNAGYLRTLWQALSATEPSQPLDSIRAAWQNARDADVPVLAASITAWQAALWKTVKVGSYIAANWHGSEGYVDSPSRQAAVDLPIRATVTARHIPKPAAGVPEVTLRLSQLTLAGNAGPIQWQRPRIEAKGKLVALLRDHAASGAGLPPVPAVIFATTAKHLAAAAALAADPALASADLAAKEGVDPALLGRWVELVALVPPPAPAATDAPPAANPAPPKPAPAYAVPADTVLGRWIAAAKDPARRADAELLATEVQTLLTGPQPKPGTPDRALHDKLTTAASPLYDGVDVVNLSSTGMPRPPVLTGHAFDADGNILATTDKPVELRLPVALFAGGRELVVDATLPDPSQPDGTGRLVAVRIDGGDPATAWSQQILGTAPGPDATLAGGDEFRKVFPLYLCFPAVVPQDEVVCLKMFHREDEPLLRLFATAEQAREIDRLWVEHTFVSRQPVAENDYLPQFMGFTTQDTKPAFQKFFVDRKPLFQNRADEHLAREQAAIPRQLVALADFAERAYRRPLAAEERSSLQALYERVRSEGASHDEAFRGALARVLVSPAFLFRIESPPAGEEPARVNDHELATRLSYFLWSSLPDAELREAAASGRLRDPTVLAAQAKRMLQDPRARALAIEFGTQWIHVRGLDELKEKNEKLYPTFNAELRRDIYEESILFFLDFFQADRPVLSLLDADHTFVNEALAKHYGIPNVAGPQWRRIDGVRQHGRGGVLGLASVQAKQSGASRTSPVLRGAWVVETLLGEKLPRPPANVPQLPDQEGTDNLTTRKMVERHVADPACAGCHSRIDPFGFAFENFDAIGRFRTEEAPGRPVDTTAKLRDGTEFTGLDGLREYLIAKKQSAFVRLFCQRLLGYALGRSTTLSDTALIDTMAAAVQADDGRVSSAILAVLESPQFLMIRGRDADYPD